jgi:site-specific recombinase XerD
MEPAPTDPIEAIKRIRPLVLDSVTSTESKRLYGRGIDRFVTWVQSERPGTGFNKASVQAFRSFLIASGLGSSTVNLYLTALRRLAFEAADNGLMSSEVAAAITRVKGMKREGVRTGSWLTVKQAEDFINAPDSATVKGKRDRALLAVLIGCGLRRKEAASLTVEHIQEREGRWIILDMRGKGRKRRTVPMPSWSKAAIDEWTQTAGFAAGRLFRPVNKGGRLTAEKMSAQSVFVAVKHYAQAVGFKIAPHDLRRTYARLAYDGGSTLEQIQLSLAHFSVVTTERYVGVQQNLKDGPCDHLGIKP